MSNNKEGHYITDAAVLRFKKWLLENHLTVNSFSKKCGCSRQYIEKILKGQRKVTDSVRNHFKSGGYELL